MADQSFSLSTTLDTLLSLQVEEVLAKSEKLECVAYGDVFFRKAREAEAAVNAEAERGWRLLVQLVQVRMQADKPGHPYRPFAEGLGGRSLLPSDLDDTSASAVCDLGKSLDDPELRARLLDIGWVRLRDVESARLAVSSYMDAAKRLFDLHHWMDYVERGERALRLAAQIRDKSLVDSVAGEMERRVVEIDGCDPLYMTARLMELLYEFEYGEPDEMTRIAETAVQSAEAKWDYERARTYLENIRRWRRKTDDDGGERDARVRIAQSYVKEADLYSVEGSELRAAVYLEKAHEVYRQIEGMREYAEEVYTQLRTAQRKARSALQEVRSDSIDITEPSKNAREHVSGKTLSEALLALATIKKPTNFDKETEKVRDLMTRLPLQNLFGGARLDHDGRSIAHITPAIGGDEKQQKQALWEKVVESVSQSYQIDAQAMIVPAIYQLTFEHEISVRDLRDLVVNNPFVPEGHEDLFAKGFVAGFRWNFPESLSILVPQLENSLRHLLSRAGYEVTTRDKLGLQSVIQMGSILSYKKRGLEQIISSDIVNELKVLFSEKHGMDLRNRIAHGLMSHDDYFSSAAVYAWWIIFIICINPVHHRFEEPE